MQHILFGSRMGGELTKAANARGSLEVSAEQVSEGKPSPTADEDEPSDKESQLY